MSESNKNLEYEINMASKISKRNDSQDEPEDVTKVRNLIETLREELEGKAKKKKFKKSDEASEEEYEEEAKLKVETFDQTREKLIHYGAKFVKSGLENNDCYDFNDRKIEQNNYLLRLRDDSELTLKKELKSSKYKKRPEQNIPILHKDKVLQILDSNGLTATFSYKKQREIYEFKDGTKVCLDTLPDGIGNYVEIEGEEKEIGRVRALLGLENAPLIKESYPEIIKEVQEKNKG